MKESLLEKLQEAEACARCEHEKRLGIEQQRDELLEALKGLCGLAELRPGYLHKYKAAVHEARAIIARVEGEK